MWYALKAWLHDITIEKYKRGIGMRKKWLAILLAVIIAAGCSACSGSKPIKDSSDKSSQNTKKETEQKDFYKVAENLSVKDGENGTGELILLNTEFEGFKFSYSESQEILFIYFKLNEEGQKKLSAATNKYVANPGFLSLWVGDEKICANKLWSQITTEEFVVLVKEVTKESAQSIAKKIEGQSSDSKVPQEEVQDVLPDIETWQKEVLSDKPDDTQIRYSYLKRDGSSRVVLEVTDMTEEHDIDNDGHNEVLVFMKKDKKNIGIYDVVDGALRYRDVSNKLGATWSEYMGNMSNVDSKYQDCIEVAFEDLNADVHYDVYKYDNGKLIYVCPFYDALREY